MTLYREHKELKSLSVGHTVIDEFWKNNKLKARKPGGNAFVVASWLDYLGFESYLSSILGDDFPDIEDINTKNCIYTDSESPNCKIFLNEEEMPEERKWTEKNYEKERLTAAKESYDLIFLTNGEKHYNDIFTQSEAEMKAFSPGALIECYEEKTLDKFMKESDIMFLNKDEAQIIKNKTGKKFEDFPKYYDISEVIVTGDKKVKRHKSNSKEVYKVNAVKPIDTTGAGDAFAATYLASIFKGKNQKRAIYEAINAGTETVKKLGALPDDDNNEK